MVHSALNVEHNYRGFTLSEYFDMMGKQITTESVVIFPIYLKGSSYLKIGIVKKLNPKTITVNLIENTKPIYTPNSKSYRMLSKPYIGREHRIRNPNRCMVLNPVTLPKEYFLLLKG